VLRHPDAGLWIALLVEDATWLGFTPEGGRDQLWVFTPDGSWAMIENATMTVEQHGPRRLWEEVEAADQRWVDAGKPTRDRMGLTVTKSGLHQFWLDEPDNVQWDDDQK
jgi:protein-L-isoaspartate(D-aspartate) O-methyltransferase